MGEKKGAKSSAGAPADVSRRKFIANSALVAGAAAILTEGRLAAGEADSANSITANPITTPAEFAQAAKLKADAAAAAEAEADAEAAVAASEPAPSEPTPIEAAKSEDTPEDVTDDVTETDDEASEA